MENHIKLIGSINVPKEKQPECFARLMGLVSAGGMMTCDIEGPLVLLKPPEPDTEDFSVFFNYNYFDNQGFYEPAGFSVKSGQLLCGDMGSSVFGKVVQAMCQLMASYSSTPCRVVDEDAALIQFLKNCEYPLPTDYLGVSPDDTLLFWSKNSGILSNNMADKLDALWDELQKILLSPIDPLISPKQFSERLSQALVRAQKEGTYCFASVYQEFLEQRERPEWQAALIFLERLLYQRTAHVFDFSTKQYFAVLANPDLRAFALEF